MVGLVVVSHSENLAKSVVELTALMAPAAPVAAAGGMADGGFGTCFEKIRDAIESVRSKDGVLVIMDLGSAVMTTEMVVELFEGQKWRWWTVRWWKGLWWPPSTRWAE